MKRTTEVLLCALAAACMGIAQNNTTTSSTSTTNSSSAPAGSMVITVRVADGAAVSGATVLLENLDTGYRQQVTTDPSGAYTFTGLPGGRYRLTPSTAQLTGTPSDVINFDASRSRTVDI